MLRTSLITLFFLIGFPLSQSWAQGFLVLATPEAPFKFEENGRIQGIDVDILKIIMNRLNVPYRIRLIRSGTRIQEEAKAGRADMLLLFSKKASRLSYLDYPQESYVSLDWNFFVRAEDRSRIRFRTFQDLKNLQVGATRDFSYTSEFWEAGLTLQVISSNDLQIKKLLGGRIDTVPMNTISTLYAERKKGNLDRLSYLPASLVSKPYYNVFPKASNHPQKYHILEKYDEIIQELKRDGTLKRVFQSYLGSGYQLPAG